MQKGSTDRFAVSRRVRVLISVAVTVVVLLLVVPGLLNSYVDWSWFGEVGFRNVWITVLLSMVTIFVAVAVLVGGSALLAMALAYRTRLIFVPTKRDNDPIAQYRTLAMRRPRLLSWGVASALAVLRGLAGQGSWVTAQLFLHGEPFGVTDPE